MMFLLFHHIIINLIDLTMAIRKSTVALLPLELSPYKASVIYPFR